MRFNKPINKFIMILFILGIIVGCSSPIIPFYSGEEREATETALIPSGRNDTYIQSIDGNDVQSPRLNRLYAVLSGQHEICAIYNTGLRKSGAVFGGPIFPSDEYPVHPKLHYPARFAN